MRRVAIFLSACGFAANFLAYVGSFSGASVDTIFPWFILLFVGWIMLFIPMYVLEYPASRSPIFFWKFARCMPSWVAPCSMALALIGIAHLVWFGVHSGLGVPAIRDGQYVLASRGRILKVLTESDYFAFRAAGIRACATIMMSFYFAPMTYWWFGPRDRAED